MSEKIKVNGCRIEAYLDVVDMLEILLTESLDVLVIVHDNDTIDILEAHEDIKYGIAKFAIAYIGYPHIAVCDCEKISMKKFKKYIRTAIEAAKETLDFKEEF